MERVALQAFKVSIEFMIESLSKISIIIVNYNTRELLRNCLWSILETEGKFCQIIVVDNASTDGSSRMVQEEFPGVLLIQNVSNAGFSKANNQGIRQATGEYVLLLNSDTIVHAGALSAMGGFLSSRPDAGAVTCKLLNEDGSIQASVSSRPGPLLLLLRLLGVSRIVSSDRARRWIGRAFGYLLGRTLRDYFAPYRLGDFPVEVQNISGACLMLRRDTVEQVGLLDERFFMYFEDMDYCLRLRRAAWKLFYLPNVQVVHLVGRSSGGRMRNYSVHSYRALFEFYSKHFSSAMLITVRLMVFATSCLWWLWNWCRSKVSDKSIYRQNEMDLKQVIRICFE